MPLFQAYVDLFKPCRTKCCKTATKRGKKKALTIDRQTNKQNEVRGGGEKPFSYLVVVRKS